MKGHRLHVRRKLKENIGKMKKLEASIIKMIQGIIWEPFVISFSELHSERRR